MSLIRTINLSKEFQRGERKFFAVKDVNFSLNEGDFVHIVGRSGSGKSTLFNLITGILKPTCGEVFIEDKLINNMNDEDLSRIRNSKIGFVPQSMGTLPNLTVLDNVRLPHFFEKRDGLGIERAAMLLDLLGIMHLKDDYCNRLSGGELKRVMIARALMNNVKILIADEPTADLDTQTTLDLMDTLKKLNNNGISMVIVTHETDILKYGNILYEMKDGSILERSK